MACESLYNLFLSLVSSLISNSSDSLLCFAAPVPVHMGLLTFPHSSYLLPTWGLCSLLSPLPRNPALDIHTADLTHLFLEAFWSPLSKITSIHPSIIFHVPLEKGELALKLLSVTSGAPKSSSTTVLYVSAKVELSKRQHDR